MSNAYKICSTYFSFHIELSHIKGFCKENSFSISLIDSAFKFFLGHIFSSAGKKPKINNDKPTLFFNTSFLGCSSLHLKSCISRLIKQCYPGYKMQIGFSAPKCISHLFSCKESISMLLCSLL